MTTSTVGPAPVDDPSASSRNRSPAQREKKHVSRYKWIRRIKNKYQARPWIGPEVGGPINLGLYPNEWQAREVIKAWVAAGAKPDQGLPPGILPKWVILNAKGTFDARARFAGRVIRIRGKATASEAFQAAYAAVDRIRKQDGWFDEPLPKGVAVRSAGYAIRYWSGDLYRILVEAGPFATPGEAERAIPRPRHAAADVG